MQGLRVVSPQMVTVRSPDRVGIDLVVPVAVGNETRGWDVKWRVCMFER